jgi:hypothetical protein
MRAVLNAKTKEKNPQVIQTGGAGQDHQHGDVHKLFITILLTFKYQLELNFDMSYHVYLSRP